VPYRAILRSYFISHDHCLPLRLHLIRLSYDQHKMCQSLVILYHFCGCTGATDKQKCSEPSPTCELLLARLTSVKLQCYCTKHSSQTFKSRHKDERESKRIDKEYQKITQCEKKRSLLQDEPARYRKEEERRGKEIEALKYEEFQAKDRRKAEEYRRRKAEKKAGLRPGISEKSDGICSIM
jgi:hypothetical protein